MFESSSAIKAVDVTCPDQSSAEQRSRYTHVVLRPYE